MRNRDPEYLRKLHDNYAEHRVLPSYSIVARLLELRSTSAVAAFVTRMRQAGFLASAPGGRLQPGPRFFERARAESLDTPAPAADTDVPAAGLQIDSYLIEQRSRTALLSMKDGSVSAAGLMPGETLVLKTRAPTRPGIVVFNVLTTSSSEGVIVTAERGSVWDRYDARGQAGVGAPDGSSATDGFRVLRGAVRR